MTRPSLWCPSPAAQLSHKPPKTTPHTTTADFHHSDYLFSMHPDGDAPQELSCSPLDTQT